MPAGWSMWSCSLPVRPCRYLTAPAAPPPPPQSVGVPRTDNTRKETLGATHRRHIAQTPEKRVSGVFGVFGAYRASRVYMVSRTSRGICDFISWNFPEL